MEKARELHETLRRARELERELGEMVCQTLREIIPDIEVGEGCEYCGGDGIYLHSREQGRLEGDDLSPLDLCLLLDVIEPLREMGIDIYMESNVKLLPGQVDAVRERLRKLLEV